MEIKTSQIGNTGETKRLALGGAKVGRKLKRGEGRGRIVNFVDS